MNAAKLAKKASSMPKKAKKSSGSTQGKVKDNIPPAIKGNVEGGRKKPSKEISVSDIMTVRIKSDITRKSNSNHKLNELQREQMQTPTVKFQKRVLEEVKPRSFVVKRKKMRRQLSTVKKRILLERLQKFLKDDVHCANTLKKHSSNTVCIANLVFREDTVDSEELEEIYEDAKELLAPFGVISVELSEPLDIPLPQRMKFHERYGESALILLGIMKSSTAANGAIHILDGTMIGGRAISVSSYDDVTTLDNVDVRMMKDEQGDEIVHDKEACEKFPWVVRLLCHRDISTMSAIQTIACQVSKQPMNMWIEEISLEENSTPLVLPKAVALQNLSAYISSLPISSRSLDLNSPFFMCTNLPWGILQFFTIHEAVVALQRLSGLVVTGQKVSVGMYDFNFHLNLLASLSPETNLRDYESRDYYELIPLCDDSIVMEARICSRNSVCVRMKDFLLDEDIKDDAERDEIFEDIANIVNTALDNYPENEPTQLIDDTDEFFPSNVRTHISSENILLVYSDKSPSMSNNIAVDVLIKLDSLSSCAFIADHLGSQHIGGNTVHAQVITMPHECFRTDSSYPPVGPIERIQVIGDVTLPIKSSVIVRGFYTFEDLEECHYQDVYRNEDDLAVSKNEVGGNDEVEDPIDYYMNEEATALKYDLIEATTTATSTSPSTCTVGRVMICSSQSPSLDEMLTMLERSYFVKFCDEKSTFAPEETFESANNSFDNDCSNSYRVVNASFYDLQAAYNFMCSADGSRLAGSRIQAFLHRCEGINNEINLSPDRKGNRKKRGRKSKPRVEDPLELMKRMPQSKYTIENVAPKYADSLNVAKQDKRSSLRRSDIAISNGEMDEIVFTMLQQLEHYQKRAIEKDPVHGKLKQRLVSGLRQVLKFVKASRAKLVIIAVDTEESKILEEKEDAVLIEAQQRNIPVLYCMNRRRLAKAINSSFRQSAVAVCDADGAHSDLKKILEFIEKFSRHTCSV